MRLCRILLIAAVPFAAVAQPSSQHPPPRKPAAAARSTRPPIVRPPAPAQPRQAARAREAEAPASQSDAAPPAAAPMPAERPAEPARGTVTGQPLPRFAALRADEVNMRAGPGTRYPVEWVYQRRNLPVEILREFDVWRLVRDPEGVQGWVHTAVLTSRRTLIVRGGEQVLRRSPDPAAQPVARLESGVVGTIRSCEAASDWCQVQAGGYRGYLPREAFWGVYRDEAVN